MVKLKGNSVMSFQRFLSLFVGKLRLSCVLLVGVIVWTSSSAYGMAGGAPGDGGDADEAPRLTLVDAIELAFAYDLEHEIARLQWENARIDNKIAEASGPISPYEQLQRRVQERRAENAYLSAHNSLIVGVVQQYFDVRQAAHQAEVARRQADIAHRELEVVREMVRIGERHPQDELREQNRVAAAELAAENATRSYSARMKALLDRIGWDEQQEPVLVTEPVAPSFDWTLEETFAHALEHNFSVWEREMNVGIAELDFEALRVQDPAPLQLEKEANNLRITQLTALQSERAFQANVISAYYAVTDAAKRYDAAQVDVDLARSAYESARRQHEIGLTTEIEWERAELDWLNAQQSYRDAVVSYMRERLDLLNLVGLAISVDEEFAQR